jgi:hypothetical protein
MSGLWRRVIELVRRDQLDRDAVEELSHHVELLATRKAAAGLDDPEARRQALIELGSVSSAREQIAQSCSRSSTASSCGRCRTPNPIGSSASTTRIPRPMSIAPESRPAISRTGVGAPKDSRESLDITRWAGRSALARMPM